MAEFKDRLEEALAMRGMRPADLSKATEIGEGAISQYKKGAYKATQRNLEKMAHALNVSIPWLMGVVDEYGPTKKDIAKDFIETATEEDLRVLDLLRKLSAEQKKAVLAAMTVLTQEPPPE